MAGQHWLLFEPFVVLNEFDWDSAGVTDETSFFVADRLRLGERVVVHLGLRFDAFDSRGDRTADDPNLGLDFDFNEMIAPRVGATWDILGNGRSKLFANFARYYESVPLWINTQAFGGNVVNVYLFTYPEDGSLPTADDPGTLFASFGSGRDFAVAAGIEPQYGDEHLLGFEYQLRPHLSLGINLVSREIGDVIDDISIDDGGSFILGNPGGPITSHPVNGQPLAEPVVFSNPVRDYKAVQLTFDRRLRNRWRLAAATSTPGAKATTAGFINRTR